ncbi:nicotinamide phosphoribosyltransferase-like [Penaeus japonicus]|uniref:nicotinamide phosphoribosyltransferase-like n=1 Tax=Penaeus japonicus TaxID=27405 RepID=UPI001C70EC07|nr:nicotinamide phosphoribosyltransferase-like [Penaeus japonicus]
MILETSAAVSVSPAAMDAGPVNNVIFLADCYKVGHHRQYPPGTTTLYSYFESRGGRFPYTVFFGLQYILKRWLVGPVVTKEAIEEAKDILQNDNFNEEGWKYILEHHGGRLPVRIKAVPEGSVIPTRNVLVTVENTDPAVPWLTNYLETVLSQVWYPIAVATNSRIHKQVIHHYHTVTGTDTNSVPYSLHDCGYRGVSSVESAAIGGAANLINFKFSDTLAGFCLLKKYYHEVTRMDIAGVFSEHSTVTSWGREREADAHRHALQTFFGQFVGCVCDSYNLYECVENILGGELKDLVIQHAEKGGILVVRPDSGDPKEVVLKCLEILGKCFGTETNSKGFKTLPPFLKVCQADGINFKSLDIILGHLKDHGWAANNVSFGSGASLLQRLDRDTQKCAYKCSLAVIDGQDVEVFKEPITDTGKKSKRGRLTLQMEEGGYKTFEKGTGDPDKDLLVTVFENGELLKDYTFDEIRQRAEISPSDPDIMKFLAEDQGQRW